MRLALKHVNSRLQKRFVQRWRQGLQRTGEIKLFEFKALLQSFQLIQ